MAVHRILALSLTLASAPSFAADAPTTQSPHPAASEHLPFFVTAPGQTDVLMSRGSGLSGLGAMQRISAVPQDEELFVVRPFLEIPKARLIATLHAAGISYADDPSNRDPRFARARLRGLLHLLAEEGLDARQLARLARRLKRADVAIENAVERAVTELFVELPAAPAIAIESRRFGDLPAEVALRLLGRAMN